MREKLLKLLQSLAHVVFLCAMLGGTTLLMERIQALHAPRAFLNKINFFWAPKPNRRGSIPQALFHGPTIQKTILGLIDTAQKSDKISITSFILTDDAIARALIAAHKREVAVALVCDYEHAHKTYSKIPQLVKAGIPVHLLKNMPESADDRPGIMHNKFMVFNLRDRAIALTGSYNLTNSAAHKNQENMVLFDHSQTVQEFKAQFEALMKETT